MRQLGRKRNGKGSIDKDHIGTIVNVMSGPSNFYKRFAKMKYISSRDTFTEDNKIKWISFECQSNENSSLCF